MSSLNAVQTIESRSDDASQHEEVIVCDDDCHFCTGPESD